MTKELSDDVGKLLLRFTVGGLLLLHGVAKLLHSGSLNFITGVVESAGLPAFVAYGVFVGEVIAPVLLIVGVFSRIGAGLVMINMLAAIGLVHMGEILQLSQHGGWALELQGFYLFGALCIALLGSGRLALMPD